MKEGQDLVDDIDSAGEIELYEGTQSIEDGGHTTFQPSNL